MENLIILGNGFDLDHELKTEYDDFRKYLLSIGKLKVNDDIYDAPIPDSMIDNYGNNIFPNKLELCRYIVSQIDKTSIDDEWGNFEELLGYIFDDNHLKTFSDFDFENGDGFDDMRNNEDIASNSFEAMKEITPLFQDWINDEYNYQSKDIKIKNNVANLLRKCNYILNFNYTPTVENIYGNENVFHIHGDLNNGIILGHKNMDYYDVYDSYPGADNGVNQLRDYFLKNTNYIIDENSNFFDGLSKVKEIYFYGFSFSKVDQPYISKLIKSVHSNSKWFLHESEYEKDNIDKYSEILKSFGVNDEDIRQWS